MKSISLLFLSALALCAQSAPTTSLSGTVSDASGSVIPSAALELTNLSTQRTLKSATDQQGRFLFTLVPPSRYTVAVSGNGTRGTQSAYKPDGANHQDNITSLNAAFPIPDALSQFTVEPNNFDAKYGGSGGAVVNIVTRSGGIRIHGTAFAFLRN